METLVVELPWWLEYLTALAWTGTSLALMVAAYFFCRTHTLRQRSKIRSGQWESLAKSIDQTLDARDCHQLQIKMLSLVHLAKQHKFWFGDAQLLAGVNAVLARRIVAGKLCSKHALNPEVVAGSTALEGEGGARQDSGGQEQLQGQEGQDSLGVIRVEALQREVPYSSREERQLLELSNELEHILSRQQH
ncbi:hypothetical protein LQU92_04175 [Kocuria sp. LUK]|uniref:hypothetical protein n=1 Tax=Kocuria sp. LUK TaxID=2897828 RepID=UPI001E491978|nr:hypothetical protein [Kocuria sp. LUK]MCD1144439.1 hypothetical protein [Kocuria sp. LUK]